MTFFIHLLIGIALAAVGVAFVMRTRDILDFFGPIDWAEQHLGGSSMFYKLLGIVLCLIGFIVATDLWDAFLNATIGQLFSVR
jgi:hypothetical protein